MSNLNVRKGDNVKILAGKSKGMTGKVVATDPKTGKVLVEGANMATHHIKPRSATEQGGKKTLEAPIDISNVQIICPSCNEHVRVRHQKADGKTVRICAKCGASLDVAAAKADKKKKAEKGDKKATKAKKSKATAQAEESKVPVEEASDGKTE